MSRTNTSKTRNVMEMKCMLSRKRVKVVSKEFVSNVDDVGREGKEKEARWIGRKEKVDPEERVVQRNTVQSWSHVGQFLVQFTLVRENVGS